MFCRNCGNEMSDKDRFCTKCGKASADAVMPLTPPVKKEPYSSTLILVFGIVGLALEMIGGIVFGAITMHMAKAYANAGCPLTGKVKTGRILGIVGFINGIVTTVVYVIFVIVFFAVLSDFFTELFSYGYVY